MKLYTRPPVSSKNPLELLSRDDYKVLAHHHKIFSKIKDQNAYEKEQARWPEDSLKHVAYLRDKLLAWGFVVSFVNEHDEIVFGVMEKSAIQMELERNAEKYERRGEQLRDAGAGFDAMRMPDAA